jgi:hypothetical protein
LKREPKPKVQPWPNSTFALKMEWEDWGTERHLWVHLERRAPGKFGRLEAMHALVPAGRRKSETDSLFGSTRYRRATLDGARKLFQQAGVPDEQAEGFMQTIAKEYPYPTAAESFAEQISSPLFVMALGERIQDLTFHRTGVPVFTPADLELIQDCMKRFENRVLGSPQEGKKFLDIVVRRGLD